MKVYYAHCMSIYNTPQEERDLNTLAALGFDILNPNVLEHQNGYKNWRGYNKMGYFFDLVKECDVLAFRALPTGEIPAGVGGEIETALENGIYVFELPSGLKRRRMSVENTREYLAECGQR